MGITRDMIREREEARERYEKEREKRRGEG
jgi:hypothetical protein